MNIMAKITDARAAAAAASYDFEQKEMGSADFFSSFATWNKLNSELDTLEKVQNLITTGAFAGIGTEAISIGLERVFSSGMQFTPSMIDAQALLNAANGAMLEQDALDTVNNALDYAQADLSSNMSDNYVPYGGVGNGFSNYDDDNASPNNDQGNQGGGNFSPYDSNAFSSQPDGNSNAQIHANNGATLDNGASYSSVMSGDYLGAAGSSSDNGPNYGDCPQKNAASMTTYPASQPVTTLNSEDYSNGSYTQDMKDGNPSTNSASQAYDSTLLESNSSSSGKKYPSGTPLSIQICEIGLVVKDSRKPHATGVITRLQYGSLSGVSIKWDNFSESGENSFFYNIGNPTYKNNLSIA